MASCAATSLTFNDEIFSCNSYCPSARSAIQAKGGLKGSDPLRKNLQSRGRNGSVFRRRVKSGKKHREGKTREKTENQTDPWGWVLPYRRKNRRAAVPARRRTGEEVVARSDPSGGGLCGNRSLRLCDHEQPFPPARKGSATTGGFGPRAEQPAASALRPGKIQEGSREVGGLEDARPGRPRGGGTGENESPDVRPVAVLQDVQGDVRP